VVRDALRDWKVKRLEQTKALLTLRSDIKKGLADAEAGRVKSFDSDRIVARGRKLMARR
jgi:Arc/MetJ-type ribon-helix-helix transcriptional regulator